LIESAGQRSQIKLIGLEIGHSQAAATAVLLEESGFGEVQRLRDLAGHERVVLGRR
jgi:release factor glutamine methyltransferase